MSGNDEGCVTIKNITKIYDEEKQWIHERRVHAVIKYLFEIVANLQKLGIDTEKQGININKLRKDIENLAKLEEDMHKRVKKGDIEKQGKKEDIVSLVKEIEKPVTEIEKLLIEKETLLVEDDKQEIKSAKFGIHIKKLLDKNNNDTVGLALSGGGIRSATFNLGLLQALKRWYVFPFIDYISTVSGGGYIGACLTWLMSTVGKFPFGLEQKDYPEFGKVVLHWLRSHGKYLVPGEGINIWSLLAAVIKGTFINMVILVPLFLLIIKLLSLQVSCSLPVMKYIMKYCEYQPTFFTVLVLISIVVFAAFLSLVILSALTSQCGIFRTYRFQLRASQIMGFMLLFSVAALVVGSVPFIYYRLPFDLIYQSISAVSISGLVALLGALKGLSKKNETVRLRSLVLSVGLMLVIYGIFLLLYDITGSKKIFFTDTGCMISMQNCCIYFFMAAFSILLALFTDVNHISMHRYYRDRLMEAYMPPVISDKEYDINPDHGIIDPQTGNAINEDPDNFRLSRISNTAGNPYPLINTNMLTINSDDASLHFRGGDNFILSPLYCGSASTGYRSTRGFVKNRMKLSTAFAISGAAVDPNTYLTRSRPVAFLMSLVNARLGYWVRNPNQKRQFTFTPPMYLIYMLLEMFGFGLKETNRSIHLADGGHFENLGVYELIRRRCKYIIVSDAGADPGCGFADLAKSLEMARVDFGVKVNISLDDLKPDKKTGFSKLPFAIGTIIYPDMQDEEQSGANKGEGRDENKICHLIYIKATMIKAILNKEIEDKITKVKETRIDWLPVDVEGYKKANKQFPHESTGDQFFDEDQFEAYRELGYSIGTAIFQNMDKYTQDMIYTNMEQMIHNIWTNADTLKNKLPNQ